MTGDTFDLTTRDGRAGFLRHSFDVDSYLDACAAAARAQPEDVDTVVQFADGLRLAGRNEERLARLSEIRVAHPTHAMANIALGLALMEEGRYREGWPCYRHRLRLRKAAVPDPGLPPERLWKGEPLRGKRLCLYREQGLGDTVQFARYAIDLARAGTAVALNVQPGLVPLLEASPAVGTVLRPGMSIDLHAWSYLLDLVPVFTPHRDDIRWPGAYVAPPVQTGPVPIAPGRAGDLRVGLAWYGNPENASDSLRSAALADFAPLAEVPGVALYGLQRPRGPDSETPDADSPWLTDLSDRTYPFEALAQAIAAMDVVVTVCTSVAHLAGAMGKPVFILLCTIPDWRWGRGGETTPWYPSARLFRQQRLGDWSAPMARAAEALAKL